jgi:GNAT superfamily N-acetyltransferase
MSNLNIKTIVAPQKEDRDAVITGLLEFNGRQVGPSNKTEVTIHVHDSGGKLVGGANGYTHWNYFFLEHLWISEDQRGKRIGSKIVEKVEAEARSRKCTHCWLDTFSFQAAGFYEKLGYSRFGELKDYPLGHKRFFYVKELGS